MRGETSPEVLKRDNNNNFNPLSPCGERQQPKFYYKVVPLFQSTLPMRGETYLLLLAACLEEISIHSPHAGRDV